MVPSSASADLMFVTKDPDAEATVMEAIVKDLRSSWTLQTSNSAADEEREGVCLILTGEGKEATPIMPSSRDKSSHTTLIV